mmetsp:Transcript_7738/g.12604  ORF Transcript_7738/g.12604 Transcript_7738/m.12604 type:complete len:236 (-) Transcript_7738:277-984(-)
MPIRPQRQLLRGVCQLLHHAPELLRGCRLLLQLLSEAVDKGIHLGRELLSISRVIALRLKPLLQIVYLSAGEQCTDLHNMQLFCNALNKGLNIIQLLLYVRKVIWWSSRFGLLLKIFHEPLCLLGLHAREGLEHRILRDAIFRMRRLAPRHLQSSGNRDQRDEPFRSLSPLKVAANLHPQCGRLCRSLQSTRHLRVSFQDNCQKHVKKAKEHKDLIGEIPNGHDCARHSRTKAGG